MGANIARDVTFRATMVSDVDKGAKRVAEDVRKTVEGAAKAGQDAERVAARAAQERARAREATSAKHSEGSSHFSRIFNDQSTTGLGPLGRAASGILGDHLGTGMGIGAIAVASATLSNLSERAIAFRDHMRESNMGAAQMAVELGESVPVLGGIVRLGQNIREIWTEEKYQYQKELETRRTILELSEREYAFGLKNAEVVKDRGDALKRIMRDTQGVGLRGPSSEAHAFASERAGIKDAAETAKKKAKDSRLMDPDVKKAQDALAAFNEVNGEWLAGSDPKGLQAQLDAHPDRLMTTDDKKTKALYDQQQALEAARDKVVRDRDAATKAESDSIDADAAAKLANAQARHKEYLKLHAEERRQTAAQSKADALGASGAYGAERLGTAGYAAASRRAEIQAAAEQQREQARIEAQGRTNATDDAGERQEIQSQLATKLLSITEKANADLAAADKAAGVERRRMGFDAGQAAADATASAEAQRLREIGQGYDAERTLRKREFDKQAAEIDERAEAEITQNRDNEKQIRAKAASDKATLGAKYREGERQAGEGQRAGEFGTARDLVAGRIDSLKEEAKFGNLAAATEARRLEIATDFASKREKLNQLIRDPNTNAAMKAQAQSQLAALGAQEAREQRFANFTGGASLPTLALAGRVSGAALRANEENSPFIQLSRIATKQQKTLENIQQASEVMAKVFAQNPQLAALFTFKPSR